MSSELILILLLLYLWLMPTVLIFIHGWKELGIIKCSLLSTIAIPIFMFVLFVSIESGVGDLFEVFDCRGESTIVKVLMIGWIVLFIAAEVIGFILWDRYKIN